MAANDISIQVVLNEINTPLNGIEPRKFDIGFIRKTKGPAMGTYKLVKGAMKYGSTGRATQGAPPKARQSFNSKEGKTLRLMDAQLNPFFVGLETIIYYNGKKVRH